MYYLAYFLVIVGCLREIVRGKRDRKYFNFCYVILTLMAVFRFGQGTDYFSYEALYKAISQTSFIESLMIVNGDIGYGFLCNIGIFLGMPFALFCACISLGMMALFYKFLTRTCNYSMFGLLAFVSVIYMIYVYSIIRQGVVMSIYFGTLFPVLQRRRYLVYSIGVIMIATIHASALLLLTFPVIQRFPIQKFYVPIFLGSIAVMFLSSNITRLIPVEFIRQRLENYEGVSTGNIVLARMMRIVIILPLIFLSPSIRKDKEIALYRNYMLIGFLFYSVFSFSEMTCSRVWGYFLGFECALISHFSLDLKKVQKRFAILSYYSMILVVMWFKDIGAAIDQGSYRNCGVFTYPYFSVFESIENVAEYRDVGGSLNEFN